MQLVINTHGTRLHKEGERFLIQAGEKNLAVSAQKIQSIVLAMAATITSGAIGLAVAYDICHPKRLHKIARTCEDFGFRRQYSVFLCRLSSTDLVRLKSRLHDIINL
jgi:hypothetical protein